MLGMHWVAAALAACGFAGAADAAYGRETVPVGVGSQPDAANEAHRAWVGEVMVQLAESGGARELAFAALLLPIVGTPADGDATPTVAPEGRDWVRRASAKAGSDPIANHLVVGGIAAGDDVELVGLRRAAAARWRAAEPDNLAALLYADLEPQALLAAAASARRFDLHYMEMVRAMAQMLATHPPGTDVEAALAAREHADGGTLPSDAGERATLFAAGLAPAFAMPGLQKLTAACSQDVLADATRRGACNHVAAVMRTASDTELGEGVGRALARRLASTDELRTIDAEARLGAWRMHQVAVATSDDGDRMLPGYYADPGLATERALAERIISDAGLPLRPPTGWSPQRAR